MFSHTGTHTIHRRNPIIDSDTPNGTPLNYLHDVFPFFPILLLVMENIHAHTPMHALCFGCVCGQWSVCILSCFCTRCSSSSFFSPLFLIHRWYLIRYNRSRNHSLLESMTCTQCTQTGNTRTHCRADVQWVISQ